MITTEELEILNTKERIKVVVNAIRRYGFFCRALGRSFCCHQAIEPSVTEEQSERAREASTSFEQVEKLVNILAEGENTNEEPSGPVCNHICPSVSTG
jgi:hypothetical protein